MIHHRPDSMCDLRLQGMFCIYTHPFLVPLVATAHAEIQRRRQLLTAHAREEADGREEDGHEQNRGEHQEDRLAASG